MSDGERMTRESRALTDEDSEVDTTYVASDRNLRDSRCWKGKGSILRRGPRIADEGARSLTRMRWVHGMAVDLW